MREKCDVVILKYSPFTENVRWLVLSQRELHAFVQLLSWFLCFLQVSQMKTKRTPLTTYVHWKAMIKLTWLWIWVRLTYLSTLILVTEDFLSHIQVKKHHAWNMWKSGQTKLSQTSKIETLSASIHRNLHSETNTNWLWAGTPVLVIYQMYLVTISRK